MKQQVLRFAPHDNCLETKTHSRGRGRLRPQETLATGLGVEVAFYHAYD